VLVVGIDDPEAAMAMVKRVRSRYPGLALVVRAHSRTDAYEYAELGVPAIRELFGAALEAAIQVLRRVGFEPADAQRVVERFRDYDERQLAQNAPHRHDESKLIALSEQGRRDIAQLLAAEAPARPGVEEKK
jgi:voltage-gated potassium channel Kch